VVGATDATEGGALMRLTVGIPFYDEERYLEAAVRSVLRQTVRDFELLLVDDGSTDRSLEIARSFDDPRVRVLSDGVRRGLPARLNQIVAQARGELVARMDGDDVAHPTRLERQLELLDRDPSLDAVGTWVALVDEDETPVAVIETARLPVPPRVALERGILPHATMVSRRAFSKKYPYDETLTRAEDRDLWCRAVQDARFGVVPEPLYVVRVHTSTEGFLADYLESQRQNREVLLRYGPRFIGLPRTLRLCAETYLKGGLMRIATRAHLTPQLVRRRGRPPTPEERRLVIEALESSRAT